MDTNKYEVNKEANNKQLAIAQDEASYFFTVVIESLQDSVVTINPDGIITSWNKSAERIYGYPAEEAIGRSMGMVTFPDDFKELL